jgi:hypothetical protein
MIKLIVKFRRAKVTEDWAIGIATARIPANAGSGRMLPFVIGFF